MGCVWPTRRFTTVTMPQQCGPARAHFGGEGGCNAVTKNNRTTHHWQCMYCDFKIGGKNWPAQKGRLHLSGDKGLASGICAKVCPNAPDNIKAKMRAAPRVTTSRSPTSRAGRTTSASRGAAGRGRAGRRRTATATRATASRRGRSWSSPRARAREARVSAGNRNERAGRCRRAAREHPRGC